MNIWGWFKKVPGTRKTCRYNTVIKFIYVFDEKAWACVVPGVAHQNLSHDMLIQTALYELRECKPRKKNAASFGHIWPGGSNQKYVIEFVFDGQVFPDGFIGWQVTYTTPNENAQIDNGGRFQYGKMHEGSLEAFFRYQLDMAELEICSKILSRE